MSRKDEILSVKALGECIGYGNMMDIAIMALEKQKELKENCDGNCSDCIYRGDNRFANDLLIDGID